MNTKLNIDWLDKSEVKSLMAIIDNGENQSRFVGGCVRDSLLGRSVSDIDIATQHAPEKVMQLLSTANITVRPTGIKHGTVSAFFDDQIFEITSLRRDMKTDGRYAEICLTDSWAEDAARRDFTMNALFMDKRGNIFDPIGGYKDLERGRIRFVGNASRRIKEDFLRILRFFRFNAYFGRQQVDCDGLMACKQFSGELWRLSGERVRSEIFKIILSDNAFSVLKTMSDSGVLGKIFVGEGRLLEFNRLTELEGVKRDPIRRLATLLTAPAGKIIDRLKLSNQMADKLIYLSETEIEILEEPQKVKALFYEMRKMDILGLLIVKTALNPKYNKMLEVANEIGQTWEIPKFPLRGSDILELGYKPGIEVGDTLKEAEKWWILGEFQHDKEDCLDWIQGCNLEKKAESYEKN
ncbi:CCA tRNA nucleotidyltransferase [Rhodospirillaceae bacterium]|nr:CCA tRNA nucleotidyltransferase [Alphaproteobacteria bacterium]MDC1441859.1 CCA tRNA nucleotidyltransferase [Rhodospirillaceae bacterium]